MIEVDVQGVRPSITRATVYEVSSKVVREGYVSVNDLKMYFEVHGDGQPLVLIMGLATDISEHTGMIKALATKFRVVAFDNRGSGRSDKPDIEYSIEMMANDTSGLMRALGIDAATVLGISMGGRIALALALQHREQVKKLILVSTGSRVVRTWRLRFYRWLSGHLFRGKYPQPAYAFNRQYQASGKYNCTNRLHEITVPTAIMHGKKDRTAPLAVAKEMHKHIKGSQLLIFSGGHLFFLFRERQRFHEAVTRFLES